jgi:hypothetical protein
MGLEALVASVFAPTASRERLAAYVARQAALGRRLAEVLADPYVVNWTIRAHVFDAFALLDDPVIARAVHHAHAATDAAWPALAAPGPEPAARGFHPEWAASAWCWAADGQARRWS